MKIIESIDSIPETMKNTVVTIGNFDGVHLGHQALFRETIRKSGAIDGLAVAMTFEPHPISVLTGCLTPRITPYAKKLELIELAGLDVLICVPFTKAFAALSPGIFVEDILVNRIGMKAAVVGPDYTFGKKRSGNIDLLAAYGESFGFEVIVPEWIYPSGSQNDRISSTLIRNLVMAGMIEDAQTMVGGGYRIGGLV